MQRFWVSMTGWAAAVFLAVLSFGSTPSAAGDYARCEAADVVETALKHGTTSGYYIPGLRLVVLNKTILDTQAVAVRRFISAHECAHADADVGADEMAADCAAARRGVKEGWLGKPEIIQVCVHISKLGVDATHPPVGIRCANIRRCIAEPATPLTPLQKGWSAQVAAQQQR